MATDSYDFVIIGGGTAGLVLANRLTEDSTVQVLVLEAGEDLTSDPRVTTPALFPTLLGSDADWNTVTEPQSALYNKTINIPYGRALGGSSAINGQAFVATSKVSVDAWGELGNPGWSWDTLAPYFKKAHTLTPPSDSAVYDHLHLDYLDATVSGNDGPIKASFPDGTNNPLPKAWIETLHDLGHKATGDPFSGIITGAYTNAASIDPLTRQRSYAASAYWKPVQGRNNLTVITGAHVQKVLLSGNPPDVVAVGVQYAHNKEIKTATAKEEFILSAGSLHSPKLLELSGVGDPDLLSSLAIPVTIANKYVGENLQDHPMSGLSFEVKDSVETIDDLLRQDPLAMEKAMKQYTESKSGPLAVGGIFSYAFLPLQSAVPDSLSNSSDPSDTHPLKPAQTAYFNRLLQNPEESTAGFFTYAAQGKFGSGSGSSLMQSGALPENFYSVAICLLQPLSRGSVHIRTSDPSDAVKVDPRYLTHPLDLEVFARHMTYISTIISTEPLASLLKRDGRRNAGAPADLTDLDAMKEYVRQTTLSSWHPTSTCAMLPLDKGGVVNERLVVHGTRNLRVVDASVFPITTRGNPMATVYAVAERAADLVKEDLEARRQKAKGH
ncbi:glucose-methanol-choline oxidoreductase-like protein [Hypomontagnella monticulosa]|nr:glucose-methanol-choline oxidoreductase-like protein [Hypomontagnella monticulosa]